MPSGYASCGERPLILNREYPTVPVLWIPAAQWIITFSWLSLKWTNREFTSFFRYYCVFGFSSNGLLAPSKVIILCLSPNFLHDLPTSSGCSDSRWTETIKVIPSNFFKISTILSVGLCHKVISELPIYAKPSSTNFWTFFCSRLQSC